MLFHTLIFLWWNLHNCHTNSMKVFLRLSWYSIEINVILCINGKYFNGKMASNKYTFKFVLFQHIQTGIVADWETPIIWNGQPKRKKTLNKIFCAKRCIQFHTKLNWYRYFSLLNNEVQRGDWWWVTCHCSVLIHFELCFGFRRLTETFYLQIAPIN